MSVLPELLDEAGTVIVLTGPSSVGKTSVATRLQMVLPRPTVLLSGDDFDLPPDSEAVRLLRSLPADALISLEERFQRGYFGALGSFALAGLNVIGEVIFKSEQMFRAFEAVTAEVPSLVVSIRCDDAVRAERERHRGDRPVGTTEVTAAQEWLPPRPDVVVDTTDLTIEDATRAIAARLGGQR